MLHAFLIFSMYIPLIILDMITAVTFNEEYKLWRSSLCNFLVLLYLS